jgi:hypothetical protein
MDRMGKINAIWHLANEMPKNPTLDMRVKWHVDHARNCQCRPLHGKILEEVKKRGIKV